ncbi:MAG: DNA (cytosine-5-)-methyltransferase [Gallionella sp.]|nr:DNA (cytosine-5-)-methyltransferase [Gallionella sp.]
MNTVIRFADLFCGIGGFRVAVEQVCSENGITSVCEFSSDIDPDAQRAYHANFGELPTGDITQVEADSIPQHDILFAGFPCQPFSICGDGKGFDDTRGTLFFDIARILAVQKPQAFVLENVKRLRGHNEGKTLARILETLRELGYHVDYRVLNALDFGVPQKRERIFIVGFRQPVNFVWPQADVPMPSLSSILESTIPDFYRASDKIRENRQEKRLNKPKHQEPTIWHENKAGNVSAYPYSCALRAGASYNYLLVDGERRLTEREMLRLQGFPDTYQIACNYQATRKQAGNSVAVPCVAAVLREVFRAMGWGQSAKGATLGQLSLGLNQAEADYVVGGVE